MVRLLNTKHRTIALLHLAEFMHMLMYTCAPGSKHTEAHLLFGNFLGH